jgi:large subunit ribosomal protein L25
MATATLTAQPRAETGKGAARSLRAAGMVPAVIYGHHREPQPLAINARELERLLEHVSGSTVIELTLDGTTAKTLVREIQRHPIKRSVQHIDFQELVAGEMVTVAVPLVLVGTAVGVREGGILEQIMDELEIEADPASIPDHIDVDVSGITIGHSLHVSDLTLPEGVRVLEDEEATIATVALPKVHTEEAPAAAATEAAVAEPEVIRKAKGEEEAE